MSMRAYVGVGSNLDPERNIPAALTRLAQLVKVTGVSTFYRTAALGPPGQPDFLNGVVSVETVLSARELKRSVLVKVEKELHRERAADRYAPRVIDLDLVLYGDLVCDEEGLVLPDSHILERPFLAFPLLELEPELVIPGTRTSLREAAALLPETRMEPVSLFESDA